MGVPFQFLTAIFLVSVSSSQQCRKFNRYDFEVECEDLHLQEFPEMKGFISTTYRLNGNSFLRLTNTTFPPGLAKEIQILRNDIPLVVDPSAFHSISSSLAVLKLQNVDFEFDEPFKPLIGLEALNSLEIGNKYHQSNSLTVPFLDDETMDRLIFLKVVHSGVEDVQPDALKSQFQRLRHLGFSHNKLRHIPVGFDHVLKQPGRRNLELDLSHNLLPTVLPYWFPSGCALTSLNLAYNEIRSIKLHAFDKCTQLSKLVLEGNFGLLYISPSVFQTNCHLEPRMEIHVQHSGIRNVEFALRPCVGRVFYWNTSIPCTCQHMSLTQCATAKTLIGECLWANDEHVLINDAWQLWSREGCHEPRVEEIYAPNPVEGAGDSTASLKDWGGCQILGTTTTSTTTTSTTKPTTTITSTTTPSATNSRATTAATKLTSATASLTATSIPTTSAATTSIPTTPSLTSSATTATTITPSTTSYISIPIIKGASSTTNSTTTTPTTNILSTPTVSASTTTTHPTSRTPAESTRFSNTIPTVTVTTPATTTPGSTITSSTANVPINTNRRTTSFFSANETNMLVSVPRIATPSASYTSTAGNAGSDDKMDSHVPERKIEADAPSRWETKMDPPGSFPLERNDTRANANYTAEALSLGDVGAVKPENQMSGGRSARTSSSNSVLWGVALWAGLLPQLMLSVS